MLLEIAFWWMLASIALVIVPIVVILCRLHSSGKPKKLEEKEWRNV